MTPPTAPDDAERGQRKPCPCHERETPDEVKGWHDRKGPLPLLREHNGKQDPAFDGWMPQWADHTYRLRVEGRWRYVAEPYQLYDESLSDLVMLAEAGYDVTIDARAARHYPGQTVAVLLDPPTRDNPA